MTIITALIQPFMLNKVTSALEAISGFSGVSITETPRFGRMRSLENCRALQIGKSKEKVCIEIASPNEKARQIF